MITADAFNLAHTCADDLWLQLDNAAGYKLVDDQRRAGAWTREACERFLSECRDGVRVEHLRLVPAPRCGCCGDREIRQVRQVEGPPVWRCEKHVLRNPCCIEGCGRTFKIVDSESYASVFICGKHWRQTPKYMRDACARVRRIAKKRGWSLELLNRHNRLFERCVRAVREGQNLDMAEIEKMFGLLQLHQGEDPCLATTKTPCSTPPSGSSPRRSMPACSTRTRSGNS